MKNNEIKVGESIVSNLNIEPVIWYISEIHLAQRYHMKLLMQGLPYTCMQS